MKNVVIVDGIRTPFIKFGTDFKDIPAHELGAFAARELLEKLDFNPEELDEVIIGNVAQPPEAINIARNIALLAGIPQNIPAFSVQRNCVSSMEAISEAWYRIQAGHGIAYLCGGVESMSKIPLFLNSQAAEWIGKLYKAKSIGRRLALFTKIKMSFFKPVVGLQLGLTDGYSGLNMGETAEILAREFKISRGEQDQYSMESHIKAEKAMKNGILAEEIMPVPIPPQYDQIISMDNGIRPGQSMEALAKLKPVFDRYNGTVTAGNSSQITDGAVMLLVMEEDRARSMGYQPLGRINTFAYAALDPSKMGLGPIYSTLKALNHSGMKMKDIQLIEMNEAFAAQILANLRIFDSKELSNEYLGLDHALGTIDPSILNVNGGAIALGHPVGASAGRLTLTLLKQMKRTGKETGVATLCAGGGQGATFIFENI
ncbi:MAG: thiolase family protein [Calditrichaceae bacterium]|nr:thiolase family protein [Calditrichaceae bacterium]MBN2708438.1 thiolase family protein [Calditrichaceae bacterium]RQV93052.1 MAG: thiolase family protein [Calditrichota bacterium]